MKNFSAVLFDMDGVLIDSRQVIEQAWTRAALDKGIQLTDDDIHMYVHGRPGQYTLDHIFHEYSEEEKASIKSQVDNYEETADCKLTPGVYSLIKKLIELEIPTALVTSSWKERIDYVLKSHSLENAFNTIINRHDVIHGKPHPSCYLLAASQLNINISDCVVFEDSISGAISAEKSGATCIGIGDDSRLIENGAIALYRDFQNIKFNNGLSINIGSSFYPLTIGKELDMVS
ncbi:HAD family hydrolase [Dongshaea marina]|uniref:HAD family hydrolase n=1 Tax=Dongshaea marina TaxID=2047966 RepID=UPI000D3E9FC1|nr:HAD family phosphatase [Dongshaea marina]